MICSFPFFAILTCTTRRDISCQSRCHFLFCAKFTSDDDMIINEIIDLYYFRQFFFAFIFFFFLCTLIFCHPFSWPHHKRRQNEEKTKIHIKINFFYYFTYFIFNALSFVGNVKTRNNLMVFPFTQLPINY